MKTSFLNFVLTIFLAFFFACSDSINESDSKVTVKNLTVTTNQSFSFELEVCADAGYQWDYSISDTSVLNIDSTSYRPKSGNWNQVGGFVIETFYFTAKNNGRCFINLIEHRIWENDIEPINSVKYIINVL